MVRLSKLQRGADKKDRAMISMTFSIEKPNKIKAKDAIFKFNCILDKHFEIFVCLAYA